MPAVASMVVEVEQQRPDDVFFFLLNENDDSRTVRHVLENVYLPLPVFLDDGDLGGRTYGQLGVGIPFGRAYALSVGDLEVTAVLTGYSPAAIPTDRSWVDRKNLHTVAEKNEPIRQ